MPTLADPAARARILTRLHRLTPDTAARWGRMTVREMVTHVHDALKMALGELAVPPSTVTPGIMRHWPVKHLVIYVLPIPKGVPTAPLLRARSPGEWQTEIGGIGAALERFAARRDGDHWPVHPTFGVLSGKGWGTLAHKHIDHHLRQFGV